MLKSKKVLSMLFALMCSIAIGVCLIVDMSIAGAVTWSGIAIVSIVFGWCVSFPLLLNKNHIYLSLTAISVLTLPFLWYLAKETTTVSWFPKLGVPLGIIGLVLIWLIYLLFRFIKIHILYKMAVSIFLITVIASPIIHQIAANYTLEKTALPNDVINAFTGIIVSAILTIWAYTKRGVVNNEPQE